ncbi:MAG TPA: glutamate-1-semialdehyde 2,1-aminomutase [Candidatus Dormibacteraeota bacterium]|nr:glutamate-1-semialdehyde 2,1-aminomutase [Candidatus Dormibacteraeota bacterium]
MASGTSKRAENSAASSERPRTSQVFERAQKILVGGVNSPVRAFRAVGGTPLVIDRAAGSRVWDVDGREYIDYVCSWGALILGHAEPDVVAAIADQAQRGTSYGMTSPLEIELGELIASAIPSIEKIRFVSSGTEAAMSAIRLARGFTSRDLILKFEGGYHGHADAFLAEAGSGLATLSISASPGVPDASAKLTLNAPYNDVEAVERLFTEHAGKIAAVIVEPVAANMGVVPPAAGFLESLRKITSRDGALLVFDEVITGFRLTYGSAQNLSGIQPDLSVMGKIIGGGLPVAAYGGRRDIMEMVAPLGPVYQAGTLSGNPLAMSAGLATLPKLQEEGFYDSLNAKAQYLADGLRDALRHSGISGRVNRSASLLTLFFTPDEATNYAQAKRSDVKLFATFFSEMLNRGVLLPPSQFEALFVSAAHANEDIDRTISAARESLQAIAESR